MISSQFIHALHRRLNGYADLLQHIWKTGELRAIQASPVMLTCSDGDRGYVYAGKQYAQLLDSINDRLTELGVDCLTIASPNSVIVSDMAFGNVVAVNGLLARASIKHRLGRLLTGKTLLQDNPLVKAWGRILDKIKPRIIIGIQPSRELCIAAKANGIWVADLQHGILSDEGYYGKAYRSCYDQAGWPDCVLCWDQRSANWMRHQAGDLVETRVIGNPWFLRFLAPRKSDNLVHAATNSIEQQKDARTTILITLQWGFDRSSEYHEIAMPLDLVKTIKDHRENYTWWLRIHPMLLHSPDRRGIFQRLEQEFAHNKNVSWVACSETPLPAILQHVDLHITSHSAVTIEASWFGIKSALLDSREHLLYEWFGEEISNGSADIVHAEKEAIRQWIENNATNTGELKSSKYMSAVPMDNFIAEMKQRVYGVRASPKSVFCAANGPTKYYA